MTSGSYQPVITALCIWREARNQERAAMCGVYWVIQNRIAKHRWGATAADVVLARLQFSSFNRGDPNAYLLPLPSDKSWLECCVVVDNPGNDPTSGATHYFSVDIQPPAWAEDQFFTCQIGAFKFYRLP